MIFLSNIAAQQLAQEVDEKVGVVLGKQLAKCQKAGQNAAGLEHEIRVLVARAVVDNGPEWDPAVSRDEKRLKMNDTTLKPAGALEEQVLELGVVLDMGETNPNAMQHQTINTSMTIVRT